jgi:hypothetical protein
MQATVITIVSYDRKTFIVKATDLIENVRKQERTILGNFLGSNV